MPNWALLGAGNHNAGGGTGGRLRTVTGTLRVSPGRRYIVSRCNVMSSVSETTMSAGPVMPCADPMITTEPRLTPVTAPVWALIVAIVVSVLVQTTDRKSTRLNSSHGYISYACF